MSAFSYVPDRETTPPELPERCFNCNELTEKNDIEIDKGSICERCVNQADCEELEDYFNNKI